MAFDLPTQIGMDPDHPMALGEVGKVGVSISSIHDMRALFKDIPLDKVSTSMTINAPAAVLLALYLAVAEEQGVRLDQVSGTIQNDILKEYMARGTYIFPPRQSLRLITDIFAFCAEQVPNWNTISISGYHIREAGCTAAQEIAFTLGDGIAYVQAALDAGLKLEAFAPRLSFFFNAHNQFFEEVAKFRAARRLWARIMKERFKTDDAKSQMLRFHTQTAGSTLTAQQPDNNIVRTTVQAMAAVCGGTQSLHTNSRDEALALPTEVSARIALRTQQILAYESRVADVVDPFAGSYFIEALTDELESRATALIAKVDELGGMVSAIEKGFPQREIQNAAYAYQKAVEKGEQVVVSVNRFTVAGEPKPDLLRVDEALGAQRRTVIAAVRAGRDQGAVDARLASLRAAATGTENLMPRIIAAVKAEATVGEICDVLRTVLGSTRSTWCSRSLQGQELLERISDPGNLTATLIHPSPPPAGPLIRRHHAYHHPHRRCGVASRHPRPGQGALGEEVPGPRHRRRQGLQGLPCRQPQEGRRTHRARQVPGSDQGQEEGCRVRYGLAEGLQGQVSP